MRVWILSFLMLLQGAAYAVPVTYEFDWSGGNPFTPIDLSGTGMVTIDPERNLFTYAYFESEYFAIKSSRPADVYVNYSHDVGMLLGTSMYFYFDGPVYSDAGTGHFEFSVSHATPGATLAERWINEPFKGIEAHIPSSFRGGLVWIFTKNFRPVSTVPEPSTIGLLGLGLAGLMLRRRTS